MGTTEKRLSIKAEPFVDFTQEGPNGLTLQKGIIVPQSSGFFENRISSFAAIAFLSATISADQQGGIEMYKGWKGVIGSIQKEFDRINNLEGDNRNRMAQFIRFQGGEYPLKKAFYTVIPRFSIFGSEDKDYSPYYILLYSSRIPSKSASLVKDLMEFFYTNDFAVSQTKVTVSFPQFAYSGVFDTNPGGVWGDQLLTGDNALHFNACTKIQFHQKCHSTFVNMSLPHYLHCSDTNLENFEEVTGGCRKWLSEIDQKQNDFLAKTFCGAYGSFQLDECLCHARTFDPHYQVLAKAGSGQFVKDACWWYPCGFYDEFRYWRASDTDIPQNCDAFSCFNSRKIRDVMDSTIGDLDETTFMLVTCVVDESGGGEGGGGSTGGGVNPSDIPDWLHSYLPGEKSQKAREKQQEGEWWKQYIGPARYIIGGFFALLIILGLFSLFTSHNHVTIKPEQADPSLQASGEIKSNP